MNERKKYADAIFLLDPNDLPLRVFLDKYKVKPAPKWKRFKWTCEKFFWNLKNIFK